MSSDRHIEERDLVNFARDELGEHKKERILAHCRECPACAERLIDATREHAPDPGPIRLTRWNKISLAALIVALVALVVIFWALIRNLDTPQAPPLPEPSPTDATPPIEGPPS